MTPEDLASKINEKHLGGNCFVLSKDIVRTILQAIKDGEVVDHTILYHDGVSGDVRREVRFQPDFEKFLEGEQK